jgi:hypothetical protein
MTSVRFLRGMSVSLVLILSTLAQANWSETFDNGTFDLSTWLFRSYPEMTGTLSATVEPGTDGNDYLALTETSSRTVGGSVMGLGFGSTEEFADVRIGALVNVVGNSRSYHGLAARTTYVIDDGAASGVPGLIANCYIMLIHWQDGPANLRIEVFKIVNGSEEAMKTYAEITASGLDHARSRYAELDVIGSDPVYITGSLYEYRGGPLLARTPTLVDTSGADSWENAGLHDGVFRKGSSAIFSMNQNATPAGYGASFDDVFSVSDGPAAVCVSPISGATAVSTDSTLSWVEASFATSRELWFGPAGAMEKIELASGAKAYDPGFLDYGQRYQWRVDEVGPSGTVVGHTWSFTAGDYLAVEDFESYAGNAEIEAAWVHNIEGDYDYVFRETGTKAQGTSAMRFSYQNQYEPFLTEATHTFETAQDWTRHDVAKLSLSFRGEQENAEQAMFVRVEDAAGAGATVAHSVNYAVQTEHWRRWDIDLAELIGAGVDLTAIAKLTIGLGDGTGSAQTGDDLDTIYIDHIRLCPAAD